MCVAPPRPDKSQTCTNLVLQQKMQGFGAQDFGGACLTAQHTHPRLMYKIK